MLASPESVVAWGHQQVLTWGWWGGVRAHTSPPPTTAFNGCVPQCSTHFEHGPRTFLHALRYKRHGRMCCATHMYCLSQFVLPVTICTAHPVLPYRPHHRPGWTVQGERGRGAAGGRAVLGAAVRSVAVLLYCCVYCIWQYHRWRVLVHLMETGTVLAVPGICCVENGSLFKSCEQVTQLHLNGKVMMRAAMHTPARGQPLVSRKLAAAIEVQTATSNARSPPGPPLLQPECK